MNEVYFLFMYNVRGMVWKGSWVNASVVPTSWEDK